MRVFKEHTEAAITFCVIVIADIILNIIQYLPNSTISITPFENIIAGLLALVFAALLAILSKFKDLSRGDMNTVNKLDEIEDIIKILPDSRIQTYKSVDEAANDFLKRVRQKGEHTVDLALLDTKIRTPASSSDKINVMRDFISYCNEQNEIKFRLLFNPATDSIVDRYKIIIQSFLKDTNSYFAYQESSISFASIIIIDDSVVSIRTPFKDGSKTAYCVVKNKALCDVYSSWFTLLWNEAVVLNKENISEFDQKYQNLIPPENKDYISKLKKQLQRG